MASDEWDTTGMYRERTSRVADAVVWQRTATDADSAQRVLPDGCMDLIWADGELVVAGPDTVAYVATGPPHAGYTGIRFAPGTGPRIAGVPAHEVRNRRVSLTELWPAAQARRLAEQIAAAPDPAVALERAAAERLRAAGPPDEAVTWIVARLRAQVPIAVIAEDSGLSERHLHRRSLAAFGYGPKVLGRILRMNRALSMARTGTPFATVAFTNGYADQAHLAREVKALSGVPLSMLTS